MLLYERLNLAELEMFVALSKALADSDIVVSLSSFVQKLNHEEEALVVVEGVRDAKALRDSGFFGELHLLCHNSNLAKLERKCTRFRKTILLLDNDQEGKRLVQRVKRALNGRVAVDLFYQKEMLPASKGRIRHVEEFSAFADRLASRIQDKIP